VTIAENSRDIAQSLAATAIDLATTSSDDALIAITRCAAESLPGVDFAAVAYLEGGRKVAVRAQSDPIMTEIDDLQTELQQGPCLHTLQEGGNIIRVDDFTTDTRWPDFSAHATGLGVRSCRSFRLFVGDRSLGTLSVFAREPNAFTADTEVFGELFATHASIALAGTRRETEFTEAVRHRDVIGQAKGVLMARHGLDEEAAFATLVKFSQSQNIKLYDVALRLMDSVRQENAAK
jgi:GAF domain-containing protein